MYNNEERNHTESSIWNSVTAVDAARLRYAAHYELCVQPVWLDVMMSVQMSCLCSDDDCSEAD